AAVAEDDGKSKPMVNARTIPENTLVFRMIWTSFGCGFQWLRPVASDVPNDGVLRRALGRSVSIADRNPMKGGG
ncbi:MAG: hypothetical protein ACLFQQ_08380, partial [Desulfococcaceae bacterium]